MVFIILYQTIFHEVAHIDLNLKFILLKKNLKYFQEAKKINFFAIKIIIFTCHKYRVFTLKPYTGRAYVINLVLRR